MKVWLVTIGEPLPLPGQRPRLLRTGLLAGALAARGHHVTWWSSGFDHTTKREIPPNQAPRRLDDGTELVLLRGIPYAKNLSWRRLINHWQLGRRFAAQAPAHAAPDLIVASYPTIELSDRAVAYGRRRGVPVVVDVRDLWPDILHQAAPPALGPLTRFALLPLDEAGRRALRGASAILAISESYLTWALERADRGPTQADAVFPLGYPKITLDPARESAARSALLAKGVVPGRHIFCFVGSFGKTYDLHPIMVAAEALRNDGKREVQFVVAGTGEYEARWRREAATLDNVILTGWLDADQLALLLRYSTAGIAAYARGAPQSLPNKYAEYASAGLPILSSLEGEGREFLSRNGCGLTYQVEDPSSLLSAIRTLLYNEDARSRMAEGSARVFDREFDAEGVTARMIGHLEKLVAPGASSRLD